MIFQNLAWISSHLWNLWVIKLLQQPDFAKVQISILSKILERDDLAINEIHVFNAVLMWSKTESGREWSSDDKSELAKHIRLSQIPIDQLLGVVDDSKLFLREEIFRAAKNQMHPSRASDELVPQVKRRRLNASQFIPSESTSCHSFKLTNSGMPVEKTGADGWNCLVVTSQITVNSHLACAFRIDRITRSDVSGSGLIIGAVADPSGLVRSMVDDWIGLNGTGTFLGGLEHSVPLTVGDIVCVSVEFSERRVTIDVYRGSNKQFSGSAGYPLTWDPKRVAVGAFLYYRGQAVTICARP